jgi:hypothetical protein
MIRALVVVAAMLMLAGCGVPAPTTPQPVAAPQAVVFGPVGVSIPAAGADSDLEPVGLNPDGTMAVPPVDRPGQAAWFEPGVRPGEVGPAVVVGHVSGQIGGQSVPGVFARLDELAPGDDVWVDRGDGSRLRFAVDRVEQHPKDQFPTAAVYGDTLGPELRLITCGGALDTSDTGSRSYGSNVIVFAQLVAVIP